MSVINVSTVSGFGPHHMIGELAGFIVGGSSEERGAGVVGLRGGSGGRGPGVSGLQDCNRPNANRTNVIDNRLISFFISLSTFPPLRLLHRDYPFLHHQSGEGLRMDYLGHEECFKGNDLFGVRTVKTLTFSFFRFLSCIPYPLQRVQA
jgi:hypothetical protein